MPTRPHDELVIKHLRNSETAAAFLNSALESNHAEYITHAINLVRKARDPRSRARIEQESIEQLDKVLSASRLRLRFEPDVTKRRSAIAKRPARKVPVTARQA